VKKTTQQSVKYCELRDDILPCHKPGAGKEAEEQIAELEGGYRT
jgi:hypothetical protein